MKQLLLTCLVIHICVFNTETTSVNVCNSQTTASALANPAIYMKNHILDQGVIDFGQANASSFQECIRMCCDKVNCNFAFLKDSQTCFLIACHDDLTCKPILNPTKQDTEPVDHLVHIRSVADSKSLIKTLMDRERNELVKLENKLETHTPVSAVDKNPECIPGVLIDNISPCPVNENCVKRQLVDGSGSDRYECVCPRVDNMRRVEGVCREILPNTRGCIMFLNECEVQSNEECVVIHGNNKVQSKHGSCQCRLGYRRDLSSFKCLPEAKIGEEYNVENKEVLEVPKNNRRRPSPAVSLQDAEHLSRPKPKSEKANTLWGKILEDLGLNPEQKSDNPNTPRISMPNRVQNLEPFGPENSKEDMDNTSPITTTTTTSTTTTTTTTTPIPVTTDPPNIHTNNLFADSGTDMHVYYPSKSCVLNGSMTRFTPASPADRIERWLWEKSNTSPAFGQFVGSNESPVVIYEQMVEGVYRFILRVWTNTNEYSQSTVHVYVHSTVNSNRSSSSPSWSPQQLNENIILVELDIEPSLFSEYLKERFVNQFQIMLNEHRRQFKLLKPRVILVNSRIAAPVSYSKKSSVILELIVTDVINESVPDFELPGVVLNRLMIDDSVDLVGDNRRIVENSHLIRLMRRHQSVFRFSVNNINNVWAYLGKVAAEKKVPHLKDIAQNLPASMVDSLEIKVLSVSKLTCTGDFYSSPNSNSYNCSNHGKCDFNSHKCICNKYWMPNLYLKYFDYESDLTNGNNCEYNIPLVIILSILAVVITLIIIKAIFKYFFYYLFCCCLCNRDKKSLRKNRAGRKFNGNDSYLDDDDLNTSETSDLIKSKVKSLKKPFEKLSNNRTQYSLLRNEDNDSITWRGSKPSDSLAKNLNYDDDEDVIYDETKNRNKQMMSRSKPKDEPKKYSVI